MKNKNLKAVAFVLAIFTFCTNLTAQIKTKVFYSNTPTKYKSLVSRTYTTHIIEAPKEFYILKAKKNDDEEMKFAFPVKTNFDFIKNAKRENETGMQKYSLTINAKDALNISLKFSEFKLPKSAVLSIFNEHEVTDSITANENNENNIWATRVYQGNNLSIVLKMPSGEKENPRLEIGVVNFGYKNFGTLFDFGNIGLSAGCEINANCPAGAGWDNEKNSIAMIVVDGIEQCTGSLLMNTCSNNIPYVLTANHCLAAGNIPNWVFQFQTLSSDCVANIGWREDIQFNGCTLRANNATTDFALLQLNNAPLPNSGLFYSGWSRQTAGINSVTILHHPQGDLMKVSRDINAPVALNDIVTGVDCWFLNLDNGIVEGGSSGGPYYNQNHQIIGQHFRRPQNVGNPPPPPCAMTQTLGGRFDQSWTGGGTNATRLSNWLDPSNSGAMTTNTTNVSGLINPITSLTISGASSICTGTTSQYSVNAPSGVTVNWVSSNPSIATVPATGNPVTVTKVSNGNVTLTATYSCGTPISASKAVHLGTYTNSDYIISGNNGSPYYCTNQTISFGLSAAYSALGTNSTNLVWTLPTNWTMVYNGGSYVAIKSPSTTSPPTGSLSVSFTDDCGAPQTKSFFLAYSSSACVGTDPRFTYSPNPAPSTLYVAVASGYTATVFIKRIQIVNTTGVIVFDQSYGTSGVSSAYITTSGFSPGTYTLRIYDGSVWAVYQFVR